MRKDFKMRDIVLKNDKDIVLREKGNPIPPSEDTILLF
jgi:hypothetical protein